MLEFGLPMDYNIGLGFTRMAPAREY